MRNALAVALAAGLTLALSGTAFACNWNKTASKEMTVAEKPLTTPVTEEAVTTFEPVKSGQLEELVDEE